MTKMVRHSQRLVGARLFLMLLVLGGSPPLQISAAQGKDNYVGKWWLAANEYQRLAFVDGYITCYYYMVDPKRPFQENIKLYVKRVDEYLEQHPQAGDEPVDALLWRAASPPYSKPPIKHAPGGEEAKEKWGFYDGGNYWLLGQDSQKLGFIQGFLHCYDKRTDHPEGMFSKPREWYVKAIDDWYGDEPHHPSAIVKSRVDDKVPEVLFRFSDKGTSKSK
jgi:hypothetical protein